MNKEQKIEEIIKFPLKYAVLLGFKNETGLWDKEKLTFLEKGRIDSIYSDLQTFERNNKQLHGEN